MGKTVMVENPFKKITGLLLEDGTTIQVSARPMGAESLTDNLQFGIVRNFFSITLFLKPGEFKQLIADNKTE